MSYIVNLIQKNFIYNNLLGFTNLFIPILIFPYISRVLGPVGIGLVSFAVSLTAIFALIGSLGIPIYGIREIAKVKNNKRKLSKIFSELFFIQVVWVLITLFLYFIWLYFTETFKDNDIIKYFSYIHIFGIVGMFSWFFQGIENYKFITIINFITKILMIILLIVLVKNQEQYWIYYTVIVVTTFIGTIISIFYALSFVKIKYRNLNFKKHLKPILILFSTQLAIGIYINLDIVFLSYFSNNYEVGLYTPPSKLIKIILILVTSLGTVLIPKLSLYIRQGKLEESKEIITKSLRFVFLLSFPICILLFCLSSEIIYVFAGEQFGYSSILLLFLTPLIILIGLSNIFSFQILVPADKEKKLMKAVIIGAFISVVLNYILIPDFKSLGAALSILITELVITLITFYYARQEMRFNFPLKNIIHYFLLSIFIIPMCYLLQFLLTGIIYLLISSIFSLFIYIIGLHIIKDKFFLQNIWIPILNLKK